MKTMNVIDTLHTAGTSAGASQAVSMIGEFQYSDIVKTIIQLLIAIGTLVKLFKKPVPADKP